MTKVLRQHPKFFSGLPNRKPGRPTLISQIPTSTFQEYLKAVRLGAYAHDASHILGITYATWHNWMTRGREGDINTDDRPFVEFFDATTDALAECRTNAAIEVRAADPKWWLTYGPAKRDWSENANKVELTMQGEVTQQHLMAVDTETYRPAPRAHLAQALVLLEEMGIMPKASEEGKRLATTVRSSPISLEEEEKIIDADFEDPNQAS